MRIMRGAALAFLLSALALTPAYAQTDPLPSWNDGAVKHAATIAPRKRPRLARSILPPIGCST